MSYNSNKAYGNSSSYSFSSRSSGFSEYVSTFNQMNYSNKTIISYSGNSNTNHNTPLFSNNEYGGGLGNNRNYIRNASRRVVGMNKGGGGTGRSRGKGMRSGRVERERGIGMRQACINTPDQIIEDQKNKFQSDDVDLTINKTQKTDLDIKTQKNHLDIIIEKLEEKNIKRNKKSNITEC